MQNLAYMSGFNFTGLDSILQVWIPFYKFGFHFTSLDSILQVWIPFTSLDSILQVWIPFYKFGFHFTSLDSILQVWIQFCKFGFNFQWFNYIKNFRHSWFKIISSFVPIGLVDRDTFRVKSFPNGKLSINSELIIYKLSVKILFSIFGFWIIPIYLCQIWVLNSEPLKNYKIIY
jgi:hypothetical protein